MKKNKIPEVGIYLKGKINLNGINTIASAYEAFDVFKAIDNFNKSMDCFEQFYVIYLNNAAKILSVSLIGEGGETSCTVSIMKIAQGALLQNSTSIVLGHNHPSGNLKPSKADINLTNQIKEALILFNIKVLDHLILSTENYYSFANEGII